jgi:hypothetical protein
MLFGHNSNVTVRNTTFHVQTEDRGPASALIDTTVHFNGRVLHRRTNNYFDLLPLNPDRETALKLRLDEQHLNVVEEIRSGALILAVPPGEPPPVPSTPASVDLAAQSVFKLQLVTAKNLLTGKRAMLEVVVLDEADQPVEGAKVTASVDGATEQAEFSAETGSSGLAQLEFEMPHISNPEAVLAIEASKGNGNGQLRFQLRPKPRANT